MDSWGQLDDGELEGVTWSYLLRLFALRGPVTHWWSECGPVGEVAGIPAPIEFGLADGPGWKLSEAFRPIARDDFELEAGRAAVRISINEPCPLRDRIQHALEAAGASVGIFGTEGGRSGLAGPWSTERGTLVVHTREFWRTVTGAEFCLWSSQVLVAVAPLADVDRQRIDPLVGTLLQQAAYAAENPLRTGEITQLLDVGRSLAFSDVPEELIPRPRVIVESNGSVFMTQPDGEMGQKPVSVAYGFGYEVSGSLTDDQLLAALRVCVDAVTDVASLLESGRDHSPRASDDLALPTTEEFVDPAGRVTVALERSTSPVDDENPEDDDERGFGRPPFIARRSGWTTGLESVDFSPTPIVASHAGEFPLMDMWGEDELIKGLKRRDPDAMAIVERWSADGQLNLMSAMGVVLAMMADAPELGVSLVRRSAEQGNMYAWFILAALLADHLTSDERREACENGARARHAGCAELLALMSADDGDDEAALKWLTRAAQWGNADATERLVAIVDSDNEVEMLLGVAAEQRRTQNPEDDHDDFSNRPMVGDDVDDYFQWATALTVLGSDVVSTWWRDYGPSIPIVERGSEFEELTPTLATWKMPLVMNPENPDGLASPISDDGEYEYIDLEFVQSPLAARIRRVAAEHGLTVAQRVDPSNHEGLSGLWVLNDLGQLLQFQLLQFGVFYRHVREPEREIVHWQYQALATPEYTGFFSGHESLEAGAAIFGALAYMAESEGGQHVTRETQWLDVPHAVRPRPLVTKRVGESVPTFPVAAEPGEDFDVGDCFCGSVITFGYLIDSELTDSQLDKAVISVFDTLSLSASTLRSAEPLDAVGPLLSELRIGQRWMRVSRANFGTEGLTRIHSLQPAPELRVVSRLQESDQLWNRVDTRDGLDIPGYTEESEGILLEGTEALSAGDLKRARVLFEQSAELGNGDALDMLGFLAEERGDRKAASAFYKRSAAAGSAHGMGNYSTFVGSVDDGVAMALLLSAALLREPVHRANLAKRRELSFGFLSDGDLLDNSDLLYGMSDDVSVEVGRAAPALLDRAAALGQVSALGSLTWWALLAGRIKLGLDRFERYGAMCFIRPPSQVAQPDWDYELANTRSNYAFLRLAAGGDRVESLTIWREGAAFGHIESILAPAVLAARAGDQASADAVVASLNADLLAEARNVAAEMAAGSGWISTFGRDALLLLGVEKKRLFGRKSKTAAKDGSVTRLGPFPSIEERQSATHDRISAEGDVSNQATVLIHEGQFAEGESLGMALFESEADALMRATIGNTITFSVLIPQYRFAEATALLEQSIGWNIGKQSENARSNLGIVKYLQGDLWAARRLFSEVVSRWTGPVHEALYYLWRIATDGGQTLLATGYEAELRRNFPDSEYIEKLN